MDVDQTCGDHFAKYTDIESLSCIPETNKIFCVNYDSVFFKTSK